MRTSPAPAHRLPSPAPGAARLRSPQHWPWPLPALLAWLAAWGLAGLLRAQAPTIGAAAAFWLPCALGAALALGLRQAGGVRRALVAGGFPVSALASGWAGPLGAGGALLPGWAWLLPLALLLGAYPLRAWRDAPLFPTPRGALAGLQGLTALVPGARVLDAGCGLGHGLQALREALPGARIEGIEWSWPLRLACALRCPFARVRRGDMWRDPWQGLDLVYLFQRPESMARAWAKAQVELAPGAWLASLEFEVPGRVPDAVLGADAAKPVWLYRVAQGSGQVAQPGRPPADNPSRKPARPGRPRHSD